MLDTVGVIQAVWFLWVGIPIGVMLAVKLGTYAFLMSRHRFYTLLNRESAHGVQVQKEGKEGSSVCVREGENGETRK